MNKDSKLEIYVGITEDQFPEIGTEITVIPFGSYRFTELEMGETNYKENMKKTRFLTFQGRNVYGRTAKLCRGKLKG